MACPYFYPVEPMGEAAGTQGRWPLGVLCRGMCQAAGRAFEPEDQVQKTICNTGYGRASCASFPAGTEAPDAMRYSTSITATGDLDIVFVLERDYAPARHGRLCYRNGMITGDVPDERTARQASVFAEQCRQRMRA